MSRLKSRVDRLAERVGFSDLKTVIIVAWAPALDARRDGWGEPWR